MIYINGSPLNVTLFPDNTSQVWQVSQLNIPDTNWVHIVWDFSHEGEFMQLAQLKHLLDLGPIRSTLRIKYLPYGRQDKHTANNATFALRPFANLLNSLNFEEIIIHDPHSQTALDLIHNSKAQYPTKELQKSMEAIGFDKSWIICYPDKGATDKYWKVYPYVYMHGEKTREQQTGKITKYELRHSSLESFRKNVLIVDDICDGGATFILLTKALREAGANEVNLFVTHGLFTKGLKPLLDSGIKRIFTQDGEASEVQNHIAYRRL